MSSKNDVGESVASDPTQRPLSPPGGSSDGEGGERTAREKLRKTSIAGLAQSAKSGVGSSAKHPLSESTNADEQSFENGLRGRPSKKRSFEDLQKDDSNNTTENGTAGPPLPKSGHHKRMRSRDVTDNEHIQGIGKIDDVTSPVVEEDSLEAQKSPGGPGVIVEAPVSSEGTGSTQDTIQQANVPDKEESEGQKDQSQAKPAVLTSKTSSGFGNTSSASPFGGVQKQSSSAVSTTESANLATNQATSTSAFASSGLSAFASSEKSPFGAAATAGSSGSSGFGGGKSGGFGSSTGFGSTPGGFGSASSFASKTTSGFGGGAGFGSSSGFGSSGTGGSAFGGRTLGGLSSFAGPAGGVAKFGKAKPIGGSRDDDENESENDEDNEDAGDEEEGAQQDRRFTEQEVETGEEEEETIFTCRAKLYHFEKEWKERGVGTFKINIRYETKSLGDAEQNKDETDESADVEAGTTFSSLERRARLIMRTDGVHRVVLNTPVFKDMLVGSVNGEEPSGRTMHLTGLEDGKPRGFQIKIGKEEVLKELYHKIQDLKEAL